MEVDNLLAFTSKIYFAGYTPRALSEPTPESVARVRQEIEAQRTILARFGKEFPPEKEPLYNRVKELIDRTTQRETQVDAFGQLEKLGLDGVPAMIMLMDDRRDLAIPAITFVNPPGHWEGLRHYGPRKVVDAISAVLNQITSQVFGSIYNGASEKERQEAVNGWKLYLYHWKKRRTESGRRALRNDQIQPPHAGSHLRAPSVGSPGEAREVYTQVTGAGMHFWQ